MIGLQDALTDVRTTAAALDAANRSTDPPLALLPVCGARIRALEVALDAALHAAGQPPLDPVTLHIQGRTP